MEKTKTKESLLLIDANSLIHRAYHALPPLMSPSGKSVGALYGFASMLLKILREGVSGQSPTYIVAAFDRPEPTFRKQEYDAYKATRVKTADDLVDQLVEARSLLDAFSITFFEEPGWEADDIIATLAKQYSKDISVVILSGDSDILQAIRYGNVVVVAPQKGINYTVIYDESVATEKFGVVPERIADYKGLVGDTSDNIPGVQGIGPKTAVELINKYGSIEDIYAEIDEIGIPETKTQDKLIRCRERALLSKRLAVLHDEIPLAISLEGLRYQFTKEIGEVLEECFSSLGFTSLVPRVKRYYNEVMVSSE
ncbi:MAG: 5'-3' exonuclease H3TH domain-containing protein [bacterium]